MIMMGCIISTYSQQIDTSYLKYMKQDLIRRSANNKTAGFVLLGAGGVMIVGGIAGMSSTDNEDAFVGYSALTGFGLMSGLTSLPLFIISGSQSMRAARIGAHVKLENHLRNINQIPNSISIGQRQVSVFPAISLKIEIGR